MMAGCCRHGGWRRVLPPVPVARTPTAAGAGDQRPLCIVGLLQVLGLVEPGHDEVGNGVGQEDEKEGAGGDRSDHGCTNRSPIASGGGCRAR